MSYEVNEHECHRCRRSELGHWTRRRPFIFPAHGYETVSFPDNGGNCNSWQENFGLFPSEIAASLGAALDLAADTEDDKLWIIGGGSVYTAMLSRCKRVYLTKVDAVADGADTFFPNLDKLPAWEVEHTSDPITENGVTYQFIDYVNTKL